MSEEKTATTFPMVAKTLSGLEDVLADELTALGAHDVLPVKRAVEFAGDKRLMYKANLWCRMTTRILRPIKTFRAITGDELYHFASQVDWGEVMSLDQTFAIDAVVQFSEFNNSLFVAQKTKDAIADWFRKRTGKRPSVDVHSPDVRINIHIRGKRATLSLDSSGESLSRRGYRTEGGKAPLSEVLAAGILRLTEWDMASPLIDGMCGSGTFPIEAAQMAANMAPGMTRKGFCFMNWPDYDHALLGELVEEARAAVRMDVPCEIVASDIEADPVRETKANAKRAGVAKIIRVERKAFEVQHPPQGAGMLIVNPPYGERMPVRVINEFYTKIGDTLKQRYNGYNAFIFTGSLKSIKFIGLRSSRRITLFNGPLECRLLKYEMYRGSRKHRDDAPPPGE